MSVNGVTGGVSAYDYKNYKADAKKSENTANKDVAKDAAAVYEPSEQKADAKVSKAKGNSELVNKLKADAEARVNQLQDIVTKLLTKQGNTYNAAKGLKSLYESLEVDLATKAQAQADIAEDGYWGVEQTSSRIFDFAMALSGGDEATMDKMKDAFLKGFKQATKAWGAELPEISQKTYDAVLKKFEDYKNSLNAPKEDAVQ